MHQWSVHRMQLFVEEVIMSHGHVLRSELSIRLQGDKKNGPLAGFRWGAGLVTNEEKNICDVGGREKFIG